MEHESKTIMQIINSFHAKKNIKDIWEIGSRDGKDSIKLSETFPDAKVVAFEPNPETFGIVEKVAMESNGKIRAINIALSDSDGYVTFYKIDTHKTVTSWPDGNPGASSMFLANNKIDIEKYVQTPVTVMANQAKTLIESHRIGIPNLIWIDAQGAEGKIFNGFDEILPKVDFIYVELSLVELYLGQPLAPEILKLLSNDFYWHSNLTQGYLQFDAFFVNKKLGGSKVKIRNLLLRLSLQTKLYIGIRYSTSTFFRKVFFRMLAEFHSRIVIILRKNENLFLGQIVMKVSVAIGKKFNLRELPKKILQIISMAQPSTPLRDDAPPMIDIAIPCHQKDFDNLQLVIQGAKSCVANPVGKILLITPLKWVSQLQIRFSECEVVSDESILDSKVMSILEKNVPQDRLGWVLQQVIKFKSVLSSEQVATLVLDADTILLNRKVWLDSNGKQVLCIGEELYWPYKHHLRRFFEEPTQLVSFVTHFQLMKKEILHEIFGVDALGLLRWIEKGDFREKSAVSEYDTYGEWIAKHMPHDAIFAKWNNVPVKIDPKTTSYSEIRKRYAKYGSISNHSYLGETL